MNKYFFLSLCTFVIAACTDDSLDDEVMGHADNTKYVPEITRQVAPPQLPQPAYPMYDNQDATIFHQEPSQVMQMVRPTRSGAACFASGIANPREINQTIEVVVRDPSISYDVIPQQMQTSTFDMITKDATQTFVVQPPVYRQIVEQVEIRPAMPRLEVVPAQYQTQEYDAVVKEATQIVEPCRDATANYSRQSGGVAMCVVNIPAQTKKITTEILIAPEQVREVMDPPIYEEITKWVLEQPAQAIPQMQSPEIASINRYSPVGTASAVPSVTAAETEIIHHTTYAGQTGLASRQILCDQDINTDTIKALQSSLNGHGYDSGSVDGIFGSKTKQALSKYQGNNGLVRGLLSLETLDALGIYY